MVLLFDLDDTLYARTLGVIQRVDRRINEYLLERIGIAPAEVDATRRRWWTEHGTTLRGLMVKRSIDPDDYLRFVHEIELDDLVVPDTRLATLLAELPGRKFVFTNASRAHAARVLGRLGVAHAFEGVFALEDLGYVPKPDPSAYEHVLAGVGAPPGECWFVDDNAKNLLPARALGMRTVWIGDPPLAEGIDHLAADVFALHELVLGTPPRSPR